MKLKPLSAQTIVLTGASSGIGLTTARQAARRGANLVLLARSEDALRDLQEELRGPGREVEVVVGDVGSYADLQRASDMAIDRFGGYDTWINNAGVSIFGEITKVSVDDHRRLFETNYWGTVYGSQIAVNHLKTNGGALINVGSAVSDRAIPLQGPYSASKAAVKGFTDALRMELANEKLPISISLIQPASINTAFPTHARNLMPKEPRLAGPVYSPLLVAEAILRCAENRIRNLFVGGGAVALSLAAGVAPVLVDLYMEHAMFDQQQREEERVAKADNLRLPTNDLRDTGNHDGIVFSNTVTRDGGTIKAFSAGLLLAAAVSALVLKKRADCFRIADEVSAQR
jgi:short-subunit dehydrogenase